MIAKSGILSAHSNFLKSITSNASSFLFLLSRHAMLCAQGLIEPAIEYATESGAFDHALELAQSCCPSKLPGIHLKHALFLEDEERFKEVRYHTQHSIIIIGSNE